MTPRERTVEKANVGIPPGRPRILSRVTVQPSVVGYQLSVIGCWLSAIGCNTKSRMVFPIDEPLASVRAAARIRKMFAIGDPAIGTIELDLP